MATKLDLADAQFIGFHFGKREPGIIGMVDNMALTAKEWEKWKEKYPNAYLSENEIQEIDDHFNTIKQ